MLCAEGIKTVPNESTGRSRKEFLQQRRNENAEAATRWNNLHHAKHLADKKKRIDVSQVAFQSLMSKKSVRSSSSSNPRSGNAAATARPSTAVGPKATEVSAVAASQSPVAASQSPREHIRDDPVSGVKRIEGRSGAQCTTYLKDCQSKKTFQEKYYHSPDKFSGGQIARKENQPFQDKVKENYRRPLSARTPGKFDVTPKVWASEEQWKSTGIDQPRFLPVHKAHLRRPEKTALDSFDIPIYSCFSIDKKFHPLIDDAMKDLKLRKEQARVDRQEKLRLRQTHQKIAVSQFQLEEEHQQAVRDEYSPVVSPRLEDVAEEEEGSTADGKTMKIPYDPFRDMQDRKKQQQGSGGSHTLGGSSRKGSPVDNRRLSPSRNSTAAPTSGSGGDGAASRQGTRSPTRLAPKPPVGAGGGVGRVIRPHTAGASRTLQHTVEAHVVTDLKDGDPTLTTLNSRPSSAKTVSAAAAPAPAQLAHPSSSNTTSHANALLKVRPHSARPLTSPRMAIDLGGIDSIQMAPPSGVPSEAIGGVDSSVAPSTTAAAAAAASGGPTTMTILGATNKSGKAASTAMSSLLATLLKGDQARRQKAPTSGTKSTASQPNYQSKNSTASTEELEDANLKLFQQIQERQKKQQQQQQESSEATTAEDNKKLKDPSIPAAAITNQQKEREIRIPAPPQSTKQKPSPPTTTGAAVQSTQNSHSSELRKSGGAVQSSSEQQKQGRATNSVAAMIAKTEGIPNKVLERVTPIPQEPTSTTSDGPKPLGMFGSAPATAVNYGQESNKHNSKLLSPSPQQQGIVGGGGGSNAGSHLAVPGTRSRSNSNSHVSSKFGERSEISGWFVQ